MRKQHLLLLVSLVFILSVTACDNTGGVEKDDGTGETEETSRYEEINNQDVNSGEQNEDDGADNKANDSEQSETGSTTEDNTDQNQQSHQESAAPAQRELPEPIVLNEQIQHPEGIIFVLEKITFEEDHILVDFNAENHSGYYVELATEGAAFGEHLGGITLEDDTGFVYRYIADENESVGIDDREKITATVSFTGRIQDDAESITLKFNEGYDVEFIFEDLELTR